MMLHPMGGRLPVDIVVPVVDGRDEGGLFAFVLGLEFDVIADCEGVCGGYAVQLENTFEAGIPGGAFGCFEHIPGAGGFIDFTYHDGVKLRELSQDDPTEEEFDQQEDGSG